MESDPALPKTENTLKAAFDAERFRRFGHEAVDLLAEFLTDVEGAEGQVKSKQSPTEAHEMWRARLQSGDADDAPEELVQQVLEETFRSAHPRNLGHQVGPVMPVAAVMDMVCSLLDTGNGVFEVGNPATPMEHVALAELASKVGFPEGADGVLTSGGSLGNLTAMLAMRQRQTGSWDSGAGDSRFAVLVSEEAHYCVDRAAKVMGWGDEGVIHVPVDDEYRMRIGALAEAYEEARSRNVQVLGVVGAAGSTATGRVDPLNEIADFCAEQDLWFHIDAAHGGGFVYSQRAKPMLAGIERADSVVIDFHKMLLSPSLLTAVLFRKAEDSFQTFAQHAGYLWQQDETHEWWDGAKRTVECTRPMLGLRAYTVIKYGRDGLFESYINRSLDVTHEFAKLVRESDDFELLIEPESNIICYRYAPPGVPEEQLNDLNQAVRAALLATGVFYIVQVEKHGKTYLRSAVMNPFVNESTCRELLVKIREVGEGLA